MNSFIPFFMFCMLSETVVSVSVSADRPSPINGDPVTLTCDITGFSAPASWRYSTTDTVLTSCLPGGPCSPTSLGKYSFSANASAIVVQISSFASSDDFGWKCQHNVDTAVFKFVFKTTSTSSSSKQCQLELGLGLGLGLGIPIVITIIVVVIFIYKGYKHAYFLGLVDGVGVIGTFQVGWIIIASLICTDTTPCKNELGLGLGLGSGMPCVITGIIAVIFVFFSLSLFEGIPSRVEFGKGILTGILFTSVIGIIVVYVIYDKLKGEPTCTAHADNPQETYNKKSKTKDSGNPAVHTGTQNKVDPNTRSKQTNDRQQLVPPANTGFEDTSTFRPLPAPPQNGEIKDRNVRGISATIGDIPDLASETPRPIRLLPLIPKQATVQKEDASEEPKRKKKKKKKKDQTNVETPEEENGETDMRVN